MSAYEFIFSDKPSIRILRHISFWVAFGIHFFIQSLLVPGVNEALTPRTLLEALVNISYFLPIYIISVYIFIETVIPWFLFRGRYNLFFICIAGLLAFNFIACYFSGLLYEHVELKIPYSQISFDYNKYHGIVNGGFVSIIILAIAGGIKIAKKWFLKQRENETLAQQKIKSDLQLLKTQVNPRFLFHSLHVVKQHILSNSPDSPKLILQVADLLSYILYESDGEYVLLAKELGMVRDYIGLEENTEVGSLSTNSIITGDVAGKYITPLILLSIVEAAFEYFLEKKQEEFTSVLNIDIKEDHLDLQISYITFNNYFFEPFELNEKFKGIQKHLHNLYPGTHQFNTESIPGKVSIILKNLSLHIPQPQEEVQITTDTYENV